MEIETKTSKILRVISDVAKTVHIIDFVTLGVWIAGAFLIKALTKIPAEVRLMYVMFITVYMLFMLVFLCLAVIVHMIKRIEQR